MRDPKPFGLNELREMFLAFFESKEHLRLPSFSLVPQDAASLLAGGLYGTENMSIAVSSYDSTMLLSVLVYLIPTFFLLRKKKIGEVSLYFGKDIQ